ncbi:hypothetical protein [Latilactobacillus sakei]|uniref:hypothetical protein n=1 Tax=Latilactobacillus sakei TaxID=1599 RepID=UPI000FFCC25B|nr:hypothetical protein [Latilactobacillus sakei]RXA81895.1 hypothetical protein EQ835_04520 [Latilactobacillus sakei]
MLFEAEDNSKAIAYMIVENSKALADEQSVGLFKPSEIEGYIFLIQNLIGLTDNLYSKLELKDDFTFEAVTNRAKSFIRIYQSNGSRDEIADAFNRLNDSYNQMLDTYPYRRNTDINF